MSESIDTIVRSPRGEADAVSRLGHHGLDHWMDPMLVIPAQGAVESITTILTNMSEQFERGDSAAYDRAMFQRKAQELLGNYGEAPQTSPSIELGSVGIDRVQGMDAYLTKLDDDWYGLAVHALGFYATQSYAKNFHHEVAVSGIRSDFGIIPNGEGPIVLDFGTLTPGLNEEEQAALHDSRKMDSAGEAYDQVVRWEVRSGIDHHVQDGKAIIPDRFYNPHERIIPQLRVWSLNKAGGYAIGDAQRQELLEHHTAYVSAALGRDFGVAELTPGHMEHLS